MSCVTSIVPMWCASASREREVAGHQRRGARGKDVAGGQEGQERGKSGEAWEVTTPQLANVLGSTHSRVCGHVSHSSGPLFSEAALSTGRSPMSSAHCSLPQWPF